MNNIINDSSRPSQMTVFNRRPSPEMHATRQLFFSPGSPYPTLLLKAMTEPARFRCCAALCDSTHGASQRRSAVQP